MLTISELSLSYGSQQVLVNLSLQLVPGTLNVLCGANGSGKSSLLSVISGVVPEYIPAEISGSILLDGIDLRALPLREKFHHLWHALSEPCGQFFFPTCQAELAFALENMGISSAEILSRINSAAEFFGLGEAMFSSPQDLSGGQQKLLLAAIGMALDPPLLLLDEPSAGLSGKSLENLRKWLEQLKQKGKIVLMAEHHPALIALADRRIQLPSGDIL